MSLRIDYDEQAISQATAFLDDPQGMRSWTRLTGWPTIPDRLGRSRTGRLTSGGCVACRLGLLAVSASRRQPGPVDDRRVRGPGQLGR